MPEFSSVSFSEPAPATTSRPSTTLFWLVIVVFLTSTSEALDWQQIPGGKFARLPALAESQPGFQKMEQTGISFTNALPPDRLLENQIRYNGSGVAAGDIDGDGWCDLFFCSLEGRSHLYKNLGNWKFVEITGAAGVACEGLFTSGAVFADVDGNGTLDLLVNAYGAGTRLFLNDGKGHFTEKKDSGLVQRFGSTSMALGDIDGNGTLDLYVANYATTAIADNPGMKFSVQRVNGKLTVVAVEGVPVQGNPELQNKFIVDETTGSIKQLGEADILYLNKGEGVFEAQSWTGGRFLDESGRPFAAPPYDYGLSVAFRDFNGDGLPDLYVANDLFTPDRVYTNQGNGCFRAASNFAIRHISDSAMGLDFADINRDGIDDFLVLEMLSRSHKLRMQQVNGLHQEICVPGEIDTRPPYNRNTLFLGRGDGTFAEIAQLARIEASDWSWMPAFLDVDLDGYEDLLIPTGYFRDSLNADLKAEFERQKAGKRLTGREKLELQHQVYKLHRQPNVAFRNRGDLTFEEAGDRWGFNELGISQGLCLADLDNDGGLDVIVNNFGAPPSLYRNKASAARVAVRLKGTPPNTHGIGAKIQFRGGPVPQSQEMMCGGRYLSCDDAERVFAAGNSPGPFAIEVAWRSGRHSLVTNAQANCIYEIDEAQSTSLLPSDAEKAGVRGKPLFKDVSEVLNHRHRETAFDDFARQSLLPRKLSQAGPGVSWVDVNGDGWPDLLIGGGRSGELSVLINNGQGRFNTMNVLPELSALKTEEGALVGLPSGTGAVVLVAQSNYEAPASNSVLQLRISGTGVQTEGGLVPSKSCPGPMALADIDGNGRLVLFVGGRVVPGQYPAPASSVIYRAQAGGGYERDLEASKVFKDVGLVNGAILSDLDGDGLPELILALDWGPIRIFHNDHGHFIPWNAPVSLASSSITNSQVSTINQLTGWWNGVATGDFDGDGRMDIVASNWGRNTRYERYRPAPLRVYFGDWNGDGQMQLLETAEDPGLKKEVPLKGLDPVREALPWVAGRFTTYGAYGEAGIQEVLGDQFAKAAKREATILESMVFLNRGDHFEARPLPIEAQFAPAFGICVADFDGDGCEDIFLAQNFYPVDSEGSRYDAGRGLLLRGDGHGNFTALPGQASGLEIYGDQRGAAVCDYDKDGRVDIAVSQNGTMTKLYHNETARPGLRVVLAGAEGNPAGFGTQMRLVYADGQGPIREVHGGGGYWSQDSAMQVLGKRDKPTALWVRWPGGKTVSYPLLESTTEIMVDVSGKVSTSAVR